MISAKDDLQFLRVYSCAVRITLLIDYNLINFPVCDFHYLAIFEFFGTDLCTAL